jgi:hypothetical protein
MAQTLPPPSLQCPAPVLRAGAQGIQRVAVDDVNARLTVVFLAPISSAEQLYLLNPLSYSLTGGVRIFPRILSAAAAPQGILLQLDQTGDFSIYTLAVNGPDIDPFFGSVKLRFRLACDDRFDCQAPPLPAAAPPPIPVAIDYLSKDYAGFRQALLDFIPARLPTWTERSEADLGMTLVELFAATADNLSYVQDRVANEAFLGSATQRRSVAGHLALIGYQMDEGASAQTWLQFQVNAPQIVGGPKGFKVGNQPEVSGDPVIVFETAGQVAMAPAHNQMLLYGYGNANCCLPASALTAALAGRFDTLKTGDYLLFDNGRGGRDVVQLTAPAQFIDPYTLVTWSGQTPLSNVYCVANSVVRGNILSATHGETLSEQLAHPPTTARQRIRLSNAPLAHLDPGTPGVPPPTAAPAASQFSRPARGISTLALTVDNQPWQERTTLLGTKPADRVFRVEIDDQGDATLVFGDGNFGKRLPDQAVVIATYRVGGGSRGNIGADTLVRALPDAPAVWLNSITNPLAATGGRDLESRDHARRIAPATFQTPLVAVTSADYENAATSLTGARGEPLIQRANAGFLWTGSWLTVTLAVDPIGATGLTPALRQTLMDALNAKRLGGYDVAITSPVYVPIELDVQFSALPGSQQADVELALIQALSNAVLPGGAKGFFHPDNFTFGGSVLVSRLFAAMLAVPGVKNAQIVNLSRLHAAQPAAETASNLAQGFLSVGRNQIVRLDNDRNFPQNGTLSVQPSGGLG